jgi:hypothetical protein
VSSLRVTDGLDERLKHSVLRTRQDARRHECLTTPIVSETFARTTDEPPPEERIETRGEKWSRAATAHQRERDSYKAMLEAVAELRDAVERLRREVAAECLQVEDLHRGGKVRDALVAAFRDYSGLVRDIMTEREHEVRAEIDELKRRFDGISKPRSAA